MQVQEDGETMPPGPGEGPVHVFDASEVRRAIAEDEEGNGQADGVHSLTGKKSEILFLHISVPMGLQALGQLVRRQGMGQGVFILGPARPTEKGRFHPFLQDQPIAQVDPSHGGEPHAKAAMMSATTCPGSSRLAASTSSGR